MWDLFRKLSAVAFVCCIVWICGLCSAQTASDRATFVPRIPGETFDCQVMDVDGYDRGRLTEILKLNADLRGAGKPELTIHDIGAMTARDVSRLRMAIRYNVDPNQLDGQMRTVTVGKTHRIVEE